MSISIGNYSANFTLSTQAAKKAQTATASSGMPTWDSGRVWGSLGDMDRAFRSYSQEWNSYYSQSFATAGAAGDGILTRDELDELLQSEFGAMGVTFIDRKPGDPKVGRHDVYIDDANRQKMADDPAYRAKMMSVIQMEMAGTTGYAINSGSGVVTNRLSGTVLSMAEGDPLYEGVPHSAAAIGDGAVRVSSSDSGESKGKGLMTLIIEKMQEMMEERRLRQEREKRVEQDGVQVDISVEARSRRSVFDSAAVPPDEVRDDSQKKPEPASLLDVLA